MWERGKLKCDTYDSLFPLKNVRYILTTNNNCTRKVISAQMFNKEETLYNRNIEGFLCACSCINQVRPVVDIQY